MNNLQDMTVPIIVVVCIPAFLWLAKRLRRKREIIIQPQDTTFDQYSKIQEAFFTLAIHAATPGFLTEEMVKEFQTETKDCKALFGAEILKYRNEFLDRAHRMATIQKSNAQRLHEAQAVVLAKYRKYFSGQLADGIAARFPAQHLLTRREE